MARTYRVIRCWCISAVILFCFGCAQENQAVKLYVDALSHRELNENKQAVEKLNASVQANQRFSLAYSLLGEIYQQANNYDESAAAYEKAAQLNPWSFSDYFNLGRVYQVMRKFTQAVKAYARACELEPSHLEAHKNTAKCYYEIKDYDNALVYGQRAVEIDPNVSGIQKLLGNIYGSQKDYSQAIAAYKRALEIDSNNPDVMTSLAVAYLKSNRNEPAKELLRSVVQIQPDNNKAYQYLGYCYLQLYYKVNQSYKVAGESGENTVELETQLTDFMSSSILSYQQAIMIDENDWEAYRGLGVAYILEAIKSKDSELKAKAVEQWRLSLKIKPDQDRREKLLKLIKQYSN